MVCFICDGCGETVKRSKIDEHAQRCNSCYSVSCVDCHISFYGDDYRSHTTCVSEAERYEKSMYRGNDNRNKKKSPVEQWKELISEAADSGPAHLRSSFQTLASYDNVPRKEKQFLNFCSNSLSKNQDFSAVWSCLNDLRQTKIKIKEQQKSGEDKNKEINTIKKQDDKLQNGECINIDNNADGAKSTCNDVKKIKRKDIAKAMKKVLKKEPNKQLKMKELRKKVKINLMFKGKKEDLKKLIQDELNDNGKKIVVIDKKIVKLVQ